MIFSRRLTSSLPNTYKLTLVHDRDIIKTLDIDDVQVQNYHFHCELGTQTWPRYGPHVLPFQKWCLYVNCFKIYGPSRRTATMETLHAACIMLWHDSMTSWLPDSCCALYNPHRFDCQTAWQRLTMEYTDPSYLWQRSSALINSNIDDLLYHAYGEYSDWHYFEYSNLFLVIPEFSGLCKMVL